MAQFDNLDKLLSENADKITVILDALIPPVQGPEAELMSAMRYAALGGGKCLRSFLVMETGKLFDVDERTLLRIGAALESVHCYSLVHDDLPCMDNDDLRRGQPTTHKAYNEATALLAGDALLTLAFEILADEQTHLDPNIRVKLMGRLANAAGARGMVGGQIMDMYAQNLGDDIASVTRMQRLKTGGLFHFAVEAGAIAGHASQEATHALIAYAHDFGLAFQITDDILDEIGDADKVGKAVGKDNTHGKATFVSLLGLEPAKERVSFLCQQAKSHLRIFDQKAQNLALLVDKIEVRQS
jgi:farnesyl diphosphate synthase